MVRLNPWRNPLGQWLQHSRVYLMQLCSHLDLKSSDRIFIEIAAMDWLTCQEIKLISWW
jgi:hypothetical protein